jgi:hypothetical protein
MEISGMDQQGLTITGEPAFPLHRENNRIVGPGIPGYHRFPRIYVILSYGDNFGNMYVQINIFIPVVYHLKTQPQPWLFTGKD